jgi:hypothetical protein
MPVFRIRRVSEFLADNEEESIPMMKRKRVKLLLMIIPFHGYSINACTRPQRLSFALNGKVVFDGTIYHRVIIDATNNFSGSMSILSRRNAVSDNQFRKNMTGA